MYVFNRIGLTNNLGYEEVQRRVVWDTQGIKGWWVSEMSTPRAKDAWRQVHKKGSNSLSASKGWET